MAFCSAAPSPGRAIPGNPKAGGLVVLLGFLTAVAFEVNAGSLSAI
jgi:hypothetical protein